MYLIERKMKEKRVGRKGTKEKGNGPITVQQRAPKLLNLALF